MMILGPEWRNWQTRRTQNPLSFTGRVGSIPSSGTTTLSGQFLDGPLQRINLGLQIGDPMKLNLQIVDVFVDRVDGTIELGSGDVHRSRAPALATCSRGSRLSALTTFSRSASSPTPTTWSTRSTAVRHNVDEVWKYIPNVCRLARDWPTTFTTPASRGERPVYQSRSAESLALLRDPTRLRLATLHWRIHETR